MNIAASANLLVWEMDLRGVVVVVVSYASKCKHCPNPNAINADISSTEAYISHDAHHTSYNIVHLNFCNDVFSLLKNTNLSAALWAKVKGFFLHKGLYMMFSATLPLVVENDSGSLNAIVIIKKKHSNDAYQAYIITAI